MFEKKNSFLFSYNKMSTVQSTVNFIELLQNKPDQIWVNDPFILLRRDRLLDFFPSKNQKNEERLNSIVRLSLYSSIALCSYYSDIKYSALFFFILGITYVIYNNHPVNMIKDIGNVAGNIVQETGDVAVDVTGDVVKGSRDVVQKAGDIIKETVDVVNKNIETFETFGESENKLLKPENVSKDWKDNKNGNWGYTSNGIDSNSRNFNKNSVDSSCIRPTIDNPFMNAIMKDYLNTDENNRIVDRKPGCDINDPKIKKEIDADFNNNLYRDVSDIFGKVNSQRNFYKMPWTTIPNDIDHNFAKWLYLSPKTCHEDQESCSKNIYEDIRSNRPIFQNPNVNPVNTKKLE